MILCRIYQCDFSLGVSFHCLDPVHDELLNDLLKLDAVVHVARQS